MHISGKFYVLLVLILLLSAGGCSSATQMPTATTVPTIQLATDTAEPTLAVETADPVQQAPVATEFAYPEPEPGAYPYPAGEGGDPAISGAPVRDNRSRVTAQVIEVGTDADNPSLTRLHVLVTGSSEIPGEANFTASLVDQEADFLVDSGLPANLQPGDTFEAEVTYRGDEHGGKYFILSFVQ